MSALGSCEVSTGLGANRTVQRLIGLKTPVSFLAIRSAVGRPSIMTRSKNLISREDAFGILRTWHKNRELLLLETFSASDKQRREFFVTTTEIEQGKPAILVITTRPRFEDLQIETLGVKFFSTCYR